MQNPNYGAPQYGGYSNGGGGTDADGDLPSALPSYIPPSQQQQPQSQPLQGMPFGFGHLPMAPKPHDLQAQFATASISGSSDPAPSSSKRQAPQGQWKTPPHFLYAANAAPQPPNPRAINTSVLASKQPTSGRDASGQPSPSTGLRSMTFQDAPSSSSGNANANGYSSGDEGKKPPPPTEIAGISAAQFAASTGGLTMDAALLARVSGTDPSLVGTEQIKQIMQSTDLLSIYQKLQEEDDRRQRRLERNRASARVRREKKKGMVETYESEVSKLENSLNLLKAHSFGTGQAQDLLHALEYSGGEHLRHAMMSKEAKTELMGRILGQHSQNTAAIRRANLENQVLIAAASDNSELFNTLRTQLRLTDEQCRHLQNLAHHTRDEARKLDAIAKCFSALRVHDWLYFPGIESLLHHTRNTMTPQQFQRFLTWTGDNSDVVERLQTMATAGPDTDADFEFEFHDD